MDLNSKIFIPINEIQISYNNKKIISFFKLHQYIGTFPYKIVNGKLNRGNSFYWCIVVNSFIFTLWLSLIVNAPKLRDEAEINSFINTSLMIFVMLTVVLSNIILVVFKNKYNNYLEIIYKDINIVTFGKSNEITILSIFSTVILIIADLFFELETIKTRINMHMMYYTINVLTASIIGQFCGMLVSIKNKIYALKDSLNLEHINVNYVDLLKKFDRINILCEDITVLYGLQIILVVITELVLLMTLTYNSIVQLMRRNVARAFVYQLWGIVWCLPSFRLIYACTQLVKQAKKFNTLLAISVSNNHDIDEDIKNKVMIHYNYRKNIEFTAFRFFKLDFPFCGSVSPASVGHLSDNIDTNEWPIRTLLAIFITDANQ
ncbi:hypothetical protein O3M35_011732 [Rhynocoris fuscipes]|uniref:Gustatory receptor n=1 Tax=Rhynocoris fuscipes TaxID=488301 RepID=A0AAW1CX98_9HEMI